MGESTNPPPKVQFDRRVQLEFPGATITSSAGLREERFLRVGRWRLLGGVLPLTGLRKFVAG